MTFSEYFNNNENYFWLTLNLSNKESGVRDLSYEHCFNSLPWLDFNELGDISNSYLKLMLFHSKDIKNKIRTTINVVLFLLYNIILIGEKIKCIKKSRSNEI